MSDAPEGCMPQYQVRRITVPTDFSEDSRAAFEYAVFLADSMRASIDLVHAWNMPAYVSPTVAVQFSSSGETRPLDTIIRTTAEAQLEEFIATVDVPEHVIVRPRILHGEIDKVILEAARESDVIVIGTHGRSGLSRMLLGSVAEKVIRQAHCPVITVRKRTERK